MKTSEMLLIGGGGLLAYFWLARTPEKDKESGGGISLNLPTFPTTGTPAPAFESPDWGSFFPDWGKVIPESPDWGSVIPDLGKVLPDWGSFIPDWGSFIPDWGNLLPDWGKIFPADDPMFGPVIPEGFKFPENVIPDFPESPESPDLGLGGSLLGGLKSWLNWPDDLGQRAGELLQGGIDFAQKAVPFLPVTRVFNYNENLPGVTSEDVAYANRLLAEKMERRIGPIHGPAIPPGFRYPQGPIHGPEIPADLQLSISEASSGLPEAPTQSEGKYAGMSESVEGDYWQGY